MGGSLDMNIERYNELKNFIINKVQIPKTLIEDYDNTRSRITAARFLLKFEKYEDALDLLLTIEEKDIKEIEQWVWILKDIGLCYWRGCDNKEKALECFKKADELAVSTNEEFSFLTRGELFENVLYALKELNRTDELQAEIKERIELFKNKDEQYKSNSYLFYAYKFIAANESDIDKALEYLYKAVKYFPLNEEQKSFKTIWEKRANNSSEAFENILDLTHHEVCWDI